MTRPGLSRFPFYLLIFGAFVFLTIPRMAQRGMFLDGVIYAAIARNMAIGLGGFWNPYFTAQDPFTEQPTLGFMLESLAFRLLGDHLYVERLFSIGAGLVTAVFIVALWRRVQRTEDGWLALLFWLLPSTITWGIVNNLLETIQAAWTTCAVLAMVAAMQTASARRVAMFAMVASTCVSAAVLTKGPVGLFPLAVAPIGVVVGLVHWRRGLLIALWALAGLAVAAAAISMYAPAREMLQAYYRDQLTSTFTGLRGTDPWTNLIGHLWGGILLRMGGLIVLLLVSVRISGRGRPSSGFPRAAVFFLLIALAASLPLSVSPRITGHYLIPSIPMYAIAFGFTASYLLSTDRRHWIEVTSLRHACVILGFTLLVAGIVAPFVGWSYSSPRDAKEIADFTLFAPLLRPQTTVGSCPAARDKWGMHAYLMRFFRVSAAIDGRAESGRFLQIVAPNCEPPAACQQLAKGETMILHVCS